ncbi:TPA: hypothetical protein RJ164_002061 [Mannheimia haemolytica]|uniref:hypothetical protein n=1 Tax=Mannheimia haemolytica TaxID=75985 RepID=UPI00094B07C7|nr:hypothetical protein [Mannheimia haemolytica]MDW0536102.1 hypothetical protein [Mannheimia haemolytica]MDW0538716.1 hypothetical protein [Mannheimia haemolytica]MDW0625895.1 hypothetical protein [Mannheimia haemolytica]MDW1158448.1 hypothetical protein [Mannheimia haemolytica]QEA91898.1 hypothetical protein BG558_07720 [Mannheimia haemolytica]
MVFIFRVFYKIILFFIVVALLVNPTILYIVVAISVIAILLYWVSVWQNSRERLKKPIEKIMYPETKYVVIPGEDNWKNHYQPKE